MNFEETYQTILRELNQGHRGLVKLSEEDVEELNDLLFQQKNLGQVLCIIEHSTHPQLKFEKNILNIMNSTTSDENLIFALNCARRHIVEARFQRGLRLDYSFLETLKNLIYHKNPEVVEWTLRLIEGCGNQGVYFLKEFDNIKPPPWKWFNRHQRAVREIITLLERRWSPFEKPKS